MSSTPRPPRPASPPRRAARQLRRAFGTRRHRLREPLARPLDRSRSRARAAAALALLLALAVSVGGALLAHRATVRAAAADRARLKPVEATVLATEQPTATPGARWSGDYQERTTVRATWTAPDGQPHTGSVQVRRTVVAGSTVTLWVDRGGTPHDTPPSAVGLAVEAVCFGLAGFAALGTGVGGALALRLRVLDRRADRAWTRSWAHHEPLWSGRTASSPGGPQDD
ncbi:hypothetical protein [Kitasatospora sp. NPDC090091]|uniref:Rv1733c family protein n=1 Tax=Kitasatospora sp. NPDC090091 TaxID=3364081 RepID=UPI00380CF6F8